MPKGINTKNIKSTRSPTYKIQVSKPALSSSLWSAQPLRYPTSCQSCFCLNSKGLTQLTTLVWNSHFPDLYSQVLVSLSWAFIFQRSLLWSSSSCLCGVRHLMAQGHPLNQWLQPPATTSEPYSRNQELWHECPMPTSRGPAGPFPSSTLWGPIILQWVRASRPKGWLQGSCLQGCGQSLDMQAGVSHDCAEGSLVV